MMYAKLAKNQDAWASSAVFMTQGKPAVFFMV
jgi:hypothetical protein